MTPFSVPSSARELDWGAVRAALQTAPAYAALDSRTRRDVAEALDKIGAFVGDRPFATQMAPTLRDQIGAGSAPPASSAPYQPPGSTTAPGVPGAPPPPSGGGGGGGGTVGRVGEVARATLSAIDFPSFVGSLIQGTFQAIVDSSIQQMEAYATLLKNVAGSVDRFMQDNVSDGMARDYLSDQFPGVFSRDSSSGQPHLQVRTPAKRQQPELPSFLKDLGFEGFADIGEEEIEQTIVPATRRFLAESRQRTLATMVLMGINRVVVDDGEINAKLQFHIDASETMAMRFDQTKTTAGNMSGYAGRSPFGAQSVMVNTASLNAQSDINVRADLTGQVKVKFRSETFPLERFADSAAIQLINGNARVPQATPAQPAQPPTTGEAPRAAAPAPPAATPPPRPATQALGGDGDAWAPEGGV